MELLGLCFDAVTDGVPHGHDRSLVALSFLVAALAAYCSLDMAERMRASSGRARKFWLALSGLMLGGGIWSMHFIAMTAMRVPFEAGYAVGPTILSGALSVFGCIAGLAIAGRRPTWRRLVAAGAVLGVSVAVMHYAGMAALEFPGEIRYRPNLFGASLLIALTAATAALWLAFSVRTGLQRLAAAGVMAVAVCGMHYTAMAGTVLVAVPHVADAGLMLSKGMLALVVAIGAVGFVIASMLLAFFDRRIQSRSEKETARLRAINAELEAARLEAEGAVRLQSRFLATMSHEIRTPMNGVLGMLEGVLRTPLSPEQRDQIFTARDSAVGLLRILNDILDYSKLEAGKLAIESTPFAPGQIVDDTVSMLTSQARAKGVALTASVASGVPDWVLGDPLRLRQVLDNLVSNALKFTAAGSVTVHVACEGEGDARRLHLSVSDTGMGMDAETQGRLFQRFMQADATTTRQFGGTGLGLAICKELVAAMGGEIGVESAPGQGSVFHVRLPAATAEAPAVPKRSVELPQAPVGPLRILVAEDNAINQRVIRTLLGPFGHDLTFANNGREAVDAVAAFPFDVVLMDAHMPEMDGVEASAAIRRMSAPACNTPIIAVTADAMSGDRERYLAAGMDDYVSKPVQMDALRAAIARVTGASVSPAEQATGSSPNPASAQATTNPAEEGLDDVLAMLEQTLATMSGTGSTRRLKSAHEDADVPPALRFSADRR